MQALLARPPLLCLRGGGSRVGQPLQSIELRRAGFPISFRAFVLLLWAFCDGFFPSEWMVRIALVWYVLPLREALVNFVLTKKVGGKPMRKIPPWLHSDTQPLSPSRTRSSQRHGRRRHPDLPMSPHSFNRSIPDVRKHRSLVITATDPIRICWSLMVAEPLERWCLRRHSSFDRARMRIGHGMSGDWEQNDSHRAALSHAPAPHGKHPLSERF
jgi:hypothetical protein